MPENEFDKQVKKMMDDLKLHPSETVWSAVEKRIREKKRRRRAFIILPLLAGMLLLGYSGIQYFFSKPADKNSKTTKQPENKVSIPLNTETPSEKNQSTYKDGSGTQEITKQKETTSLKDKTRRVAAIQKDPDNKQFLSSSRKTHENVPPPDVKDENRSKTIPFSDIKNEITESVSTDTFNQKNENKIVAIADTNTNTIKITNDSNLLKEMSFIKSSTDSSVSNKQVPDKKYTWGIHLATGISGISSKLLRVNKNNSPYYDRSANSSTGGNTYNIPIPNSSRPGIAFKAGVLVEKNLSRRSSLDLGVEYSYYSDHIKVGRRTDSLLLIQNSYTLDLLVNQFYPNSSTNNYINHYHFIELPLNYHYQLITGKQNSLNWDLGISIGQLLSTNTLVFDTTNRGVYYTDKKLFRRTQVNLSTGFSLSFNKHKSMQWIIGPQLQFGLSNLYKKHNDKKAYPYFAGLDLRLMLPKK